MKVWVCAKCSAVGHQDPDRRGCGLPAGWEHQNHSACEVCVPVSGPRPAAALVAPLCGACVAALLRDLESAMVVAAKSGQW